MKLLNTRFIAYFILAGLAFSACTPAALTPTSIQAPTETPFSVQGESSTPSPEPTPTLLPAETPLPAETKRPRYILDAVLDYDRHHLYVEETILYTNQSEDTLTELVLLVEPQNYPGVFSLQDLRWGNGTAIEGVSWDRNRMTIPLVLPVAPSETIQIDLAFELDLPMPVPSQDTRPVPFGYSARQTNLVDWYPFITPYVAGKGWLAHPPSYYGEHQVYESADFEVSLKFDPPKEGVVVAASAPEKLASQPETGTSTHFYNLQAARSFAFSISDQFQVFSQTVNGITVLSYTFPFHAAAGESALQTTSNALTLFSELFTPYPYQSLSVVEADFLDGMEYDGLFFLSNGFYNLYNGSPADYLTAIAAHETAHQWWFSLVGNDQALEPWLDEALCTYSEHLYYEKYHPEVLDWWWTYRVNYYQPSGWIDTTIYNPEGSPTPYRSYRDAVYLNGAHFFHNLRQLIGEQAFFSFLQDYASQNKHKLVTGNEFFRILSAHTQEDVSPLLNQYFMNR
jgi:hypothetical protein